MNKRMERRIATATPRTPIASYKCPICPKTIEPGAPGRSMKDEGWRVRPSAIFAADAVAVCSDQCEIIAGRLGIIKKEKPFVTRVKKP